MPMHYRVGLDDRDGAEDRRKPSIQLHKEPAVAAHESHPDPQFASQHDQLMSQRCVLSLKTALRLEWRGQDIQNENEQRDYRALALCDSSRHSIRMRFLVHTAPLLVLLDGQERVGKWSVHKNDLCLDIEKESSSCFEVWLAWKRVQVKHPGSDLTFLEGLSRKPTERR
jgi:hypothetical protein